VSSEKFAAGKLTVKEQPSASRSELQLHKIIPFKAITLHSGAFVYTFCILLRIKTSTFS
jgi:hypothetical protein